MRNTKTDRKLRFKTAAKFRDPSSNPARQKKLAKIDQGAPGTALEQLANVDPKAAADLMGYELEQPAKLSGKLSDRLGKRAGSLNKPTTQDTAPHIIVAALAGTGKTTTLVEGLKRVKGIKSDLIPSPQQAEVWESMQLSKGVAQTIGFVAFNKAIATELQRRVPEGCDASTMHSMGYKSVMASFGRQGPNGFVTQDMISDIEGRDIRELRKSMMEIIRATESLVSLVKMNLLGWNEESKTFDADDIRDEELFDLADYYEVDLNGSANKTFELIRECLKRSLSPKGKISFDDMIWLPVVCNLSVPKYDLLLCDELQDFNRVQQALALKAGNRIIGCGDVHQSIYGFAGADARSMGRMQEILVATPRGCVLLPLTVTRRCGKAIVAEAQKIVPEFEAFESNGEGVVLNAEYTGEKSYLTQVQDGDMCLCRVNAPLVSQCFRLLKQGRKATIQGRDVGKGLISTIKKMKASDVSDLVMKLDDWYHLECGKEQAKRNPNDNRLIALQDRKECLECFCEDMITIEDVIARIERIFTDDKQSPGVKFSSIHKSKGLEATNIYFLMPEGASCPHPLAKSTWQKEQEWNLKYVGVTRAISKLVFVK